MHKLPIPYKKDARVQICDLCNAKFNLLKLRQEYQDRLDLLEKKQIDRKKDLRFYTRESQNLSIQLASVKHSAESELRIIKSELQKGRHTLEQMEMQNDFFVQSNDLISQHLQASTREYKQLVSHKDQIQKVTEDRSNELVDRNLYLKQIQNEISMQNAEEKYLISKLSKAEKNAKQKPKKKKNLKSSAVSSNGLLTDDESYMARSHLLSKHEKHSEVVTPQIRQQQPQKKGCCQRCIVF